MIPEHILLDIAEGTLPLEEAIATYGADAFDDTVREALAAQRQVHEHLRSGTAPAGHEHLMKEVLASVRPQLPVSSGGAASAAAGSATGTTTGFAGTAAIATALLVGSATVLWLFRTPSTESGVVPQPVASVQIEQAPPPASPPDIATQPRRMEPQRTPPQVHQPVPEAFTEKKDTMSSNNTNRILKARVLELHAQLGATSDMPKRYDIARRLYLANITLKDTAEAIRALETARGIAGALGRDDERQRCDADLEKLR